MKTTLIVIGIAIVLVAVALFALAYIARKKYLEFKKGYNGEKK